MTICKRCKTPNDNGVRFCVNCGKNFPDNIALDPQSVQSAEPSPGLNAEYDTAAVFLVRKAERSHRAWKIIYNTDITAILLSLIIGVSINIANNNEADDITAYKAMVITCAVAIILLIPASLGFFITKFKLKKLKGKLKND